MNCPSCRAPSPAHTQCRTCGYHPGLGSRRCLACQGPLGVNVAAKDPEAGGGWVGGLMIVLGIGGAAAGWYFASSLVVPMIVFFALLAVLGLCRVPYVGLRCEQCGKKTPNVPMTPEHRDEVGGQRKKLLLASVGCAAFAVLFTIAWQCGWLDDPKKGASTRSPAARGSP